jgi:hypothetical protein
MAEEDTFQGSSARDGPAFLYWRGTKEDTVQLGGGKGQNVLLDYHKAKEVAVQLGPETNSPVPSGLEGP